jgi:ABC-type Fe3+ transport system permease subunit
VLNACDRTIRTDLRPAPGKISANAIALTGIVVAARQPSRIRAFLGRIAWNFYAVPSISAAPGASLQFVDSICVPAIRHIENS